MIDELKWFNDTVWEGIEASSQRMKELKPIRTRWVLCNKGDALKPEVRARLVACEVNTYTDQTGAFYASTPPLEAKRMLFSEFATRRVRDGKPLQLSFLDITKAYFNGTPRRNLHVRLPSELGLPSNIVGSLLRCVYGTRDAGSIWEDTYASQLEKMGFVRGKASPCCFYSKDLQVSVAVHGDDFTALGTQASLDVYEQQLQQAFDLKLRGRLSEEAHTEKEIRILNRIVRISKQGLQYEADPRHAELVVESLGLKDGNPSQGSPATPGINIREQSWSMPPGKTLCVLPI